LVQLGIVFSLSGELLLTKLGDQWDYFYTEILPVLQSLLHPVKVSD